MQSKKRITQLLIGLQCSLLWIGCQTYQPPKGFDLIKNHLPNLTVELGYATNQNFMGRPVAGYEAPKELLTIECLKALEHVQTELEAMGLGLKLYDGYRPQKAVNDFMHWATLSGDTLNKKDYYPHISKDSLFAAGYIAERSGHSRGSTVDVTLIYLNGNLKNQTLDMGGSWDFFGPRSWRDFEQLNNIQKNNRNLLAAVMQKHGFKPYSKEWWHFTLANEPFPNTYFDF